MRGCNNGHHYTQFPNSDINAACLELCPNASIGAARLVAFCRDLIRIYDLVYNF